MKRFNFNKSNDRRYNVVSSQIQSNVFNYTHAHTQNRIDVLMYFWWPCWMCVHRSGQHSWFDFQFYKHIFVEFYATYRVALTWAPNDQENLLNTWPCNNSGLRSEEHLQAEAHVYTHTYAHAQIRINNYKHFFAHLHTHVIISFLNIPILEIPKIFL